MTLENQLINKTFYESWMQEDETNHPVQVLGEAYLAEQKKELYDLSHIRFAQGEVYYHHKDYEAAIFKWENINGELEPWARKNMADSYYEMGLLSVAEDIYTSITTECEILTAEVALQLFSLYLEQDKTDHAYEVIKRAVSFHPDYRNVTALARTFYEEQEDWNSAVELAVNESIRTESLNWFDVLNTYIDQGYTKNFTPDYFYQLLFTFYKVDEAYFERVISSLWYAYKDQELYLSWIKMVNDILINMDLETRHAWPEISALYEKAYCELMEGQYLLEELHGIIPNLLTNWLRTTHSSEALFASAAVFAWSEVFPATLGGSVVKEAENLIFNSDSHIHGIEYGLDLCDSIMKWAEIHDLEAGNRFGWWAQYLAEVKEKNILIAGSSGSGKSTFINSILGENILGSTSSTVVVRHDEHEQIHEISDDEIRVVQDFSEFANMAAASRRSKGREALIELKFPCRFLNEHACSLIDTAGFNKGSIQRTEAFKHVPLADGLLFVLDANEPFTDRERDALFKLQEHAPGIPVHFLLNKMDVVHNDADAIRLVDDTKTRINAYFPDANILPYSSIYAIRRQLSDLGQFMQSSFNRNGVNLEKERTTKLLSFIRETLTQLLKKRVEVENGLINSIKRNEDMLVRLNGFINNLSDLETEKARLITQSYRTIKEEMKKKLTEAIPKLLHSCSDLVNEDSDVRNLHLELNRKMNERLQQYLHEEIIPKFGKSIQGWLQQSNEELTRAQTYLEEMSETFNGIYEEKKMVLECDLKVLEDWLRDVNRMTSRIQIEEENILLRFKPAQFLLKSAGKLLGALPQNKQLLHNQYKKYLENESYEEVTASIIRKFFLEFDLFEKALTVDINMFFKNPVIILNDMVSEARREIEESEEMLSEMKASPETYYDPLTIFELRLRQYELMVKASEEVEPLYSAMETESKEKTQV
ncbi:MAG TPA: dynamin family protein [Bacillus sp. (in: firmicutes)]|nr:dynamin family protein [Bacillus sp. (in: firmicutes)]